MRKGRFYKTVLCVRDNGTSAEFTFTLPMKDDMPPFTVQSPPLAYKRPDHAQRATPDGTVWTLTFTKDGTIACDHNLTQAIVTCASDNFDSISGAVDKLILP
jgi:hypothetical protein